MGAGNSIRLSQLALSCFRQEIGLSFLIAIYFVMPWTPCFGIPYGPRVLEFPMNFLSLNSLSRARALSLPIFLCLLSHTHMSPPRPPYIPFLCLLCLPLDLPVKTGILLTCSSPSPNWKLTSIFFSLALALLALSPCASPPSHA